MFKRLFILFLISFVLKQARAQNWGPVPCFNGKSFISRMFIDSLHDKIILNPFRDYNICNENFKGVISYDGNVFNDLNFGIDAYDTGNKYTNGSKFLGSIAYNGKTLYGGYFSSVGSNALPAEAMALWNGSIWDSFPKFTFKHNFYSTHTTQVINGFFKDNGKLWIYGIFDSIGGLPGKNLYTFDGVNYTAINIPVNNNDNVNKIIKYKDELYLAGSFYNFPYDNYNTIVKYKNGIWSNVENGIKAPLGGVADMIVYKDTLYIAGAFFKSHGNISNNLLKWDGTKFYDAGFGDNANWSIINQLLVYKNRLYAFGNYTHAANKKAYGASYYENGKWIVNTDSMTNSINNAVVYKDQIYIAGGFSSINGDSSMNYFARLKCPDFDNCKTDNGPVDVQTSIFPNPTNTEINIYFEKAFINSTITIYNDLGQLMFKNVSSSNNLKVSCQFWSKGIYFIIIQSQGKPKTFKLVKE